MIPSELAIIQVQSKIEFYYIHLSDWFTFMNCIKNQLRKAKLSLVRILHLINDNFLPYINSSFLNEPIEQI